MDRHNSQLLPLLLRQGWGGQGSPGRPLNLGALFIFGHGQPPSWSQISLSNLRSHFCINLISSNAAAVHFLWIFLPLLNLLRVRPKVPWGRNLFIPYIILLSGHVLVSESKLLFIKLGFAPNWCEAPWKTIKHAGEMDWLDYLRLLITLFIWVSVKTWESVPINYQIKNIIGLHLKPTADIFHAFLNLSAIPNN